jgi:hypothetical protein
MKESSNVYAMAALKNRRAELAGEVNRLKDQVAYRLEQLAHLDATIKLLDPSFAVETIRPKRPRQVKLFGAGELNRSILDALRRADGRALSVTEIAMAILEAKGFGEAALPALSPRVRGNLNYLLNHRRAVLKSGDRLTARWVIRNDSPQDPNSEGQIGL